MSIGKANLPSPRDVLKFWFGEDDPGLHYPKSRSAMWFRKGKHYDTEISRKFARLHERASARKLDHWLEDPAARLALIIILDQFSRHIYRGTARAFSQDAQAQTIVLDGIDQRHDLVLQPVQKVFFYFPLEHAENKTLQALSVSKFETLISELPTEIQFEYASTLNFAIRHKAVIDRFGRFPDLNDILGRHSTAAEIAFLSQPGSSFL